MSLEVSHTARGLKSAAEINADLSLDGVGLAAPIRLPSLSHSAQMDLFADHAGVAAPIAVSSEPAGLAGGGGVATNVAPAPTIANGQLWWGADVAGSDGDLGRFNTDGSTFTRTHLDSDSHGLVYDVALDTAAGFAFSVNGDNTLTAYNLYSGVYVGSALSFGFHTGDPNVDDVVSALAVDDINHFIYVGDWGSDASSTGVRKISYNSSTGAMTDLGFVFTSASTETTPNNVNTTRYTNARDFSLSANGQTLYYADNDSAYTGGDFHPTNAIYAVNVGAGGHTPVQLTSSTQFPAGTGNTSASANSPNGFISAVALDEADHRVYFLVASYNETTNASQNQLYWVDTTTPNQTAHLVTGISVGYPYQNSGLTYDSQLRQLYISDNSASHTQIIQAQLSADGNSVTSSTAYSLTTLEAGNAPLASSHVFGTALNLLPVFGLGATTTHATEQGAALDLSGTLSTTDADGGYLRGATVKISAGKFTTATSNESSAADDTLTVSLAGSTNITASYNASTETLTLTGYDTLAAYQTVLGSVGLQLAGDNPTNYGANTTRTISWSIDDGTPNAPTNGQNTGSSVVTIDAVNDAASITGANPATLTETNAGLSTSGTLTITDADTLTNNMSVASVTASGATTGLVPNNATLLSYLTLGSPTASHAANATSSTDTYAFNSAGQAFNYLAPGQTLTLTYVVSGTDSADGTSTGAHNVVVTITGTNDAPSGADATLTALEDTARVFTASDFGFSDVDGGALGAVKFTTIPGAGQVLLNGVAITAGQSVSASEIAAGHLTYLSATDASGNGYASLTFQVQDNQGTANGGVDLDQSPNTLTFNVLPLNDAPSGADVSRTILEDATYTFATSDFGFSDSHDSPANSLLAVMITTLPTGGSLTLNGVAVIAGEYVQATDISAGKLLFTPAANANGAGYGSFTFQVQDNGGTTNGGADTDASANAFTLNVTSVNDAPSGADKTVNTNEDAAYTFRASDFGFSDVDGNSLLEVKITTVPGAGSLTLSGVAVTAGQSISVANLTAGNLQFTPAHDANGAGYASFTFQVRDDGGTANFGADTDASPNTITVDVNAVNDAPSAADNTIGTNEDIPYTLQTSDFGFSDSDGNDLAAVKITSLASGGTLTLNGAAVTVGQLVSAADIASNLLVFTPSANANGTGEGSFTFKVQDDGGTANGGDDLSASHTITFDVAAVNDAPTAADNTINTNENTPYTLQTSDFGFSDSEGDSLQAVKITSLASGGTLTLNGTAVTVGQLVSAADIASNLLVFTPSANANGTGEGSFTFKVQDDGGTANGGDDLSSNHTITFDVAAVNNAPTAADNTIGTNEDTPYTLQTSDFGFSDSDGNDLAAVKITSLASGGTLTLNGAAVTVGQLVSAADIASNLLVFTPSADANGTGEGSFTFKVQDDGGTANGGDDLSTSHTITFDVAAVNDAPSAADKTIGTDEDTPYTLQTSDFGFSDSDGNDLQAVKITSLASGGTLTLNGAAVTVGQLVSAADIAANLLVFTPSANANGTGEGSFTFKVQDDGGTANGGDDLSSSHTITFDVAAVNDAPTAADKTVGTNEDTPYILQTSDFGFSDSDGNDLQAVKITSLASGGTLTLNGAAVTVGQLVSAADIAANLLVFTPSANANGTGEGSFTFKVQDDGGTANGGDDLSTSHTITFDVAAQNDDPTVNAGVADQNVYFDDSFVFGVPANAFTDVDGDALVLSAALDDGQGGTTALPSWLNFNPANGKFSGTPPKSDVGDLTVQVTASDGHGGTVSTEFTLHVVGNETITGGGRGDESLRGHNGDDVITAGTGNDTLIGSDGNDTLIGGVGDNQILGGAGDDVLRGGAGSDAFNGGSGRDVVVYYDSATSVLIDLQSGHVNGGGAAGDTLLNVERVAGSSGDDTLIGGTGHNWLKGAAGADSLTGMGAGDTLRGGDGADTLHGGGGHDLLIGGGGADVFDFSAATDSGISNSDLITDFSSADGDKLDISQLLDTDPTTHLTFVGAAHFDGTAGEVRYVVKGSDVYVSVDLNGDKDADFQVRLANVNVLHDTDFVL